MATIQKGYSEAHFLKYALNEKTFRKIKEILKGTTYSLSPAYGLLPILIREI
jgi:hypothetical protein